MSVTIRDIARALSLSPSTVSRSLQRDERIHPKTRAHVAEVAARMGYQGRARRTTRETEASASPVTLRVAMLLRSEDSHSSPNAMRFLHGMTAEADAISAEISLHALRMHDLDSDPSPDSLPPVVRRGDCDVVILEGRHDPRAVRVIAGQVPVVSCEWEYEGVPHDVVQADNISGIRQLVDHLYHLGHRRLAWLGEAATSSYNEQRRAAFIQACLHKQIMPGPDLIYETSATAVDDELCREVAACVERGATGMICVNDRVAQLVVDTAGSLGLDVPGDLSVTGFDAMGSTPETKPPLTTIDPRFVEMGRMALGLAQRRSTQPAAGHVRMTGVAELITGESTGPAPESSV